MKNRWLDRVDSWLPEIRPVVAWYDLWIGAYWDRRNRRLFLLPLPCVGFVFEWPVRLVAKECGKHHGEKAGPCSKCNAGTLGRDTPREGAGLACFNGTFYPREK